MSAPPSKPRTSPADSSSVACASSTSTPTGQAIEYDPDAPGYAPVPSQESSTPASSTPIYTPNLSMDADNETPPGAATPNAASCHCQLRVGATGYVTTESLQACVRSHLFSMTAEDEQASKPFGPAFSSALSRVFERPAAIILTVS